MSMREKMISYIIKREDGRYFGPYTRTGTRRPDVRIWNNDPVAFVLESDAGRMVEFLERYAHARHAGLRVEPSTEMET